MASSIRQDIERCLSLPNPRYPRWVIRSDSPDSVPIDHFPLLAEALVVHTFSFLSEDDALYFGRACKAIEAARKKATKHLVFSSDDETLHFASRLKIMKAAKQTGKNVVIFPPRGSKLNTKANAAFSSALGNFSRFNALQLLQRGFSSDAVAENIASLLREAGAQNVASIRFRAKTITQTSLSPLVSACPKLRSVDFPEDVTVLTTSNRDLLESLKRCPDFRFFDVVRFYPAALLSPRDLEAHLKCWPSLEAISIPASYNHEHMAVIANCCPKLRSICFWGCTHITPAAMINLADHCPLLERIDL
jgi:hypothetical protein